MKILVFSDSHGAYGKMSEVFNNTPCEAVIFLGDGLNDADRLYERSGSVPVYRVCGNCDFLALSTPDMRILEFEGKRVLITHGNRQNVKNSTAQLCRLALDNGAHIALFGHTHSQFFENTGSLILANPGSIAGGKYGILTIGEKIAFKFGDIYD